MIFSIFSSFFILHLFSLSSISIFYSMYFILFYFISSIFCSIFYSVSLYLLSLQYSIFPLSFTSLLPFFSPSLKPFSVYWFLLSLPLSPFNLFLPWPLLFLYPFPGGPPLLYLAFLSSLSSPSLLPLNFILPSCVLSSPFFLLLPVFYFVILFFFFLFRGFIFLP